MFGFFKKTKISGSQKNLVDAVQNGALLVDVRTPREFAVEHVNGSVNIPLESLPGQLDRLRGQKNIVVFCRTGMRSAQAMDFLVKNGITAVQNGGAWDEVNALTSH